MLPEIQVLALTKLQGGTIRGSLNLPAQSLYPAIPTIYTIFKAARISKVIWYCGECWVQLQTTTRPPWGGFSDKPAQPASSRGRGPRAAGWFDDHLADQRDSEMQSLVLLDGITGWATAGSQYVQWMDEHDALHWASQ